MPAPSPADTAGTPAPPRPLAVLGDSLVRSLKGNAYAEASPDALDAWADVWREVSVRYPDLTLATRLFSVGMRYLRTKDERVLLDLVQEERSILRDLFRLDDEAEKESSETQPRKSIQRDFVGVDAQRTTRPVGSAAGFGLGGMQPCQTG